MIRAVRPVIFRCGQGIFDWCVTQRISDSPPATREPGAKRCPGPISLYRCVIPLAAPAFWRLRTTNRFVNDLTLIMIVSGVVTTVFALLVRLTWRRGKKLQQPLPACLGALLRRAAMGTDPACARRT